jgi:hypothetical protein
MVGRYEVVIFYEVNGVGDTSQDHLFLGEVYILQR